AVTVIVVDNHGGSDHQAFLWTVTNTDRPPTVTNPGPQSSYTGNAVSLAVAAADPDGEQLSYSATGLPPGLSVDGSGGTITGTVVPPGLALDPASGHITGTIDPAAAGSYTVQVRASDGSQGSAGSFTWDVSHVAVANPGDQDSVNGDVISLPVAVSDPEGDPL